MKKLLLIALVVSGLAFVPVQRSDAQVSVGIGGVGIGFGYPGYRYGYYAILVMDTGIIHTDITDHIQTMAITRAARTTGIGFTATTVIITTVLGTKLA